MAQMIIGNREVKKLLAEGADGELLWDLRLPRFFARKRGQTVRFGVKYLHAGRQRWVHIGKFGPLTTDQARTRAQKLLGQVADGKDPATERDKAKDALTVAELCDDYLADCESGKLLMRNGMPKKGSTIASDKGRIFHVKQILGTLPVASVTSEDVERMMHGIADGSTAKREKLNKRHALSNVRGGKGVATRTVGLLGAIMNYAVKHKMRLDNPAHDVTKFAENKKERRLSDEEYRQLGGALRGAKEQGLSPSAVACAKFLVLTGWRSSEAIGLTWSEFDLMRRQTARLTDTKTGASVRPIAVAAVEVVKEMPRIEGQLLVFPPTRGNGQMTGFPSVWGRIAKLGNLLPDITPHVLRHSFASVAADLGYSDPVIGALIGHKSGTTTSRYRHFADPVLLAAADRVAAHIQVLMRDAPQTGGVERTGPL